MPAGLPDVLATMTTPPVPAPRGQLALVLVDVPAAACLWDRAPDAMSTASRLYHALLDRLVAEHRGYPVGGEGERWSGAFEGLTDAVAFCLAAQDELLQAEWPKSLLRLEGAEEVRGELGGLLYRGLRVSMVLHWGAPEVRADPQTGAMAYAGEAVEWAREVLAAAHPGQVLVTGPAWEDLEQGPIDTFDAAITDLGAHRFPGIEAPRQLVQVLPWALGQRSFDRVGALDPKRTNLPVRVGDFIGRDHELTVIDRMFRRGKRLVTLKGPGGMGKTRLALRYAGLHFSDYADAGGVWICDLTEARTIDGVVYSVAKALDVPLSVRSMQATNQLGSAIAARGRILVVLDNFEHVTDYVQYTVGLWLRKAKSARFVVTSRARLGLPEEAVLEVPPLDVDEGVALFLERAREIDPTFESDGEAGERVQELVSRVEGMPLAIELAAAWLDMLSPKGILDRLEDGLSNLDGAESRTTADWRPSKSSTLQQVMEWSWQQLEPWERDGLAQASVFRSGFSVKAAEQVIDVGRHRGAPRLATVLQRLRDKSLVRSYEAPGFPGKLRFGLYETVREYAAAQLASSGHRHAAESRHALYYLELAKGLVPQIRTANAPRALAQLEMERDNLLAVHERSQGRNGRRAVESALVLEPMLAMRGPFDTHMQVLDNAVAASDPMDHTTRITVRVARAEALLSRSRLGEAESDVELGFELLEEKKDLRAEALLSSVAGAVRFRQGEVSRGLADLQTAHDSLKKLGDAAHRGPVMARLGALLFEAGELGEAEEWLRKALNLLKGREDLPGQAEALTQLGNLVRAQGQQKRARELYDQALELRQALLDRPGVGRLLLHLGSLHLDRRDTEEAQQAFEQAREILGEVGDHRTAAILTGNLGRIAHHAGQGATALDRYDEAVRTLQEVGDSRFEAIFLGVRGTLLHEQGRWQEARESYERALDRLGELGDHRFEGLVLGRLGALEADSGKIGLAAKRLEEGHESLSAAGDTVGLAALEVHKGHLDIASGKAKGDVRAGLLQARERFERATKPTEEPTGRVVPAPATLSSDVRIALRLLRRSMEWATKS